MSVPGTLYPLPHHALSRPTSGLTQLWPQEALGTLVPQKGRHSQPHTPLLTGRARMGSSRRPRGAAGGRLPSCLHVQALGHERLPPFKRLWSHRGLVLLVP